MGRIRALRALGRSDQADEAIEAFRAKYPSSPYADQLAAGTP